MREENRGVYASAISSSKAMFVWENKGAKGSLTHWLASGR
jgi:hypothetical protein